MKFLKTTITDDFINDYYVQSPTKRTIFIKNSSSLTKAKNKPFFLSFPNMVFKAIYKNDKFYVFQLAFSNPTLTEFYFPPIPNVSEQLYVCLGDELILNLYCYDHDQHHNLKNAKIIVNQFWSSEFNLDITGSVLRYRIRCNQNYPQFFQSWQNNKKKNSNYLPDFL